MGLLTQGQPIPQSVVYESPSIRASFLAKVYGLLLVGLLTAAASCFFTLANPAAGKLVLGHPILGILVFFGAYFLCTSVRRVPGVNILALLLFTAVSGAFLLPSILAAAAQTGSFAVVFQAMAITGSIFAGLTLYTLVSGKDFSFMGGFLQMGLYAVLGLMLIILVLSLFHVDIQAASLALAWVGAVLFSGFILFNTSVVMRSVASDEYVLASLMLYLNVVNLFLFILQILSSGRRS